MATSEQGPRQSAARLGLWDTTSLIVGIIVGAGIYQTPSQVFQNVAGPWQAMGVWLLGGVLSLMGALCFAELASTYPRSGGEYVYLTRAYGSWVGFFFAWGQLTVVRSGGGIACLAYVFAFYASTLWDLGRGSSVFYASAVIAVLTAINILGVNPGKRTQNVLTAAKVLGLAGVVLAGFFWAAPGAATAAPAVVSPRSFALALVAVFYTFDGWNEATYVVGEVRNWRRNVPLSLILGTTLVTVIYLLINGAFLAGLGFEGARTSPAIATDLLARPLGAKGADAMSVLVLVSVLGAMNGTILASSRIYPELGADHRAFAPLSYWHPRLGTPVRSLVTQALISIAMVIAVSQLWPARNGFENLLEYTSAVFWLFFFLTSLALFVLRWKDRGIDRPFRVPGYPVVPLLFCGFCGYMFCGVLREFPMQALLGLAILLAGLPLYLLSRTPKRLPHPPLNGPVALRRCLGKTSTMETKQAAPEPMP